MPVDPGEPSALTWRESMAAFFVALVASALLFAPVLIGERCVLSFELDDPRFDIRPWAIPGGAEVAPVNPITPDADLFVLPGMMRMRQMLAEGALPWWDSNQLLGYPLAGNVPYPLWSPLTWPALALDPITAMDVTLWLHTALAMWLAWRAARLFGVRSSFAAAAGVGFALSTWMVTRWHLPQIQHTSTWWPGLLCASEWLRRGRWSRGVAEGSLALGLSMVSGFPQVAVALAGGWGLWTLSDATLRRPRNIGGVVLAGLIAACLAAPAFVTAAAAYAPSLRATEATRAATAQQSLPVAALAGALLPEAFGLPSDFSQPDTAPAPRMEDYFPQRQFWSDDLQDNVVENALYPGALLVLLFLVAWRKGVDRRARRLLLIATAALLVTLAWSAISEVPGAASLGAGNIKRILILWAGALPLAGALALEAIARERVAVPALGAAITIGVVAMVPFGVTFLEVPGAVEYAERLWTHVGVQVAWMIVGLVALMRLDVSARWTLWIPALVLACDLGWHARRFNPFPLQETAFPATPVVEALIDAAGDERVAVLGKGNLAPPTAMTLFGVRSIHGAAPMVSARVTELLEVVERGLIDPRDPRIVEPFERLASLEDPLADRLGIGLVVHGDAALVAAHPDRVAFASEQSALAGMTRPGAYPRAWTTGSVRVIEDRDERLAALATIGESGGLGHAEVVVEVPIDVSSFSQADRPDGANGAEVSVVPNGLRIVAGLGPSESGARMLVVSEAWDPGWRATVDNEPAELLIVDHALMGVVLQPGQRRVTFDYEPVGWPLARVLLALGVAAWIGVGFAAMRRRAGPPSEERTDAPAVT